MYEYCTKLKVERKDNGVLVLTLDNPPTNAFEGSMHDELYLVLEDINRDSETKVVVITGAGDRAFSAGGDINEMKRLLDEPKDAIKGFVDAKRLLNALLRLERPLIARINGHAVGLGATVALFSDLTYATENAKIADPHVGVGYAAGDGGALIWPQLIGFMRAREYLLTGDPILGKDAAAIGLINKAVPPEELDAVVYGMADRLASGASIALNLTKQAINLPLRRYFEGMIDASLFYEAISEFSDDHKEAVHAFLEKRKPKFTGK